MYVFIFSFYSWYIISVLLLYFTGSFSAPVRVTVEGFVGDSAVFSCSIPESEIQDKIEEFSAHLRDDEEKSVCDITGANRTCADQASEYKNRVETFLEDQKKGNFTFKLNALQKTDARKYHCHITGPSQNHTITELLVKVGREHWYISIISVFLLHFTDSFSVPAAPVEGFVEGSVVLSCFVNDSEHQNKIKDVNVYWRFNNSKIVIDIIGGNRTAEDQAPEYKNGVETFPEEYKKGNFSIKISNIKKTHTGKYTCTITGPFQKEMHIGLFVKVPRIPLSASPETKQNKKTNTMGQRGYVIFLTVPLLDFRGSSSFLAPVRVTVKGFVGESAVFPCSIPENETKYKLEEFKIHWRDDEGKKVCDITGGNTACQDQDPKYKDRVEYKKGTFSITLNSLQNSDARKYYFYITEPFQHETIIELNVGSIIKSRANHGKPSWIVLLISLTAILLLI
ncbi:CD276 antigen-like protein [Labeo rohita]|uniref:CD276 antigen-like protein n=1 Tax=Labeo rohita TaxID=84645 RepID=A0A498M9K9_LABRO|nr:CD276 antigen-like protein [Labeo rohita]